MSATRRGIRDPVNVLGNEIYSGHARDRNRDRRYKKTRIKRTFVCPGPLVGPGVTGDRGRSDKKKKTRNDRPEKSTGNPRFGGSPDSGFENTFDFVTNLYRIVFTRYLSRRFSMFEKSNP